MAGGQKMGLSVRAFAASIGVTEGAVRSRIKAGKRIAEAVLPDGSLEEGEARALWFVDIDVSRMRSQPPGSDDESSLSGQASAALDMTRVKAEREQVELDLAKIKLAKEEGSVIDRDEARRGVAAFSRVYRDNVLNFAARQGPELAHKLGADPRALIAELDAQMRQLLVDISKQPMPFQ